MDFFGRPNIDKMVMENDRDGLYHCLNHRDQLVRLQAAHALALLGDGTGWRVLIECAKQEDDPSLQEAAAMILGEMGTRSAGEAHRVVPVLGDALKKAHGETADAIYEALRTIGGEEVEDILRQAGFTNYREEQAEDVNEYEVHFVRPVLPNTTDIEFLSAEEHLNTAVDLRENELPERGFVECSLALWLKPNWAYAWYLRGVLFEDLERRYEAWLAYRRAVSLDSSLEEAAEAIEEINEEEYFQPPLEENILPGSSDIDWQKRRDSAAGLGEIDELHPQKAEEYASLLSNLLFDEEREVRSAAVISLGRLGNRNAIPLLLKMNESSWLLRFAIIEALSRLGSVEGLVTVLNKEMEQLMVRNPAFSSIKDPLIEVEYNRLVEAGILALERTGDIESLVSITEGNAWETSDDGKDTGWEDVNNSWGDAGGYQDDEDYEADDDLSAYVDEVGQMVSIALDRSAPQHLSELETSLLRRLAEVPDLTLIDLKEEEVSDAETALVYDLSGLREVARLELARRGGKE